MAGHPVISSRGYVKMAIGSNILGRETQGPGRKWWGLCHPKVHAQDTCLEVLPIYLLLYNGRQQSQQEAPCPCAPGVKSHVGPSQGPGVPATSQNHTQVAGARPLSWKQCGEDAPTSCSLLPWLVIPQSSREREKGDKERKEEKSMQGPVGK